MTVLVRSAKKSKDAEAICAMLRQFAGGRVCEEGVLVGTMFRAVKKNPRDAVLLVAECDGAYQGFLYGVRTYELDLFDDTTVWNVHYVYGRNVIRAFLKYMYEHVLGSGEYLLVTARLGAQGDSLGKVFERFGMERAMTVWAAPKKE